MAENPTDDLGVRRADRTDASFMASTAFCQPRAVTVLDDGKHFVAVEGRIKLKHLLLTLLCVYTFILVVGVPSALAAIRKDPSMTSLYVAFGVFTIGVSIGLIVVVQGINGSMADRAVYFTIDKGTADIKITIDGVIIPRDRIKAFVEVLEYPPVLEVFKRNQQVYELSVLAVDSNAGLYRARLCVCWQRGDCWKVIRLLKTTYAAEWIEKRQWRLAMRRSRAETS